MRKLVLDLDAIQVESFSTHSAGAVRGTVDAQQGRETWSCTVVPQVTCDNTCADTCNCGGGTAITCASCVQTCGATCFDPTCDTCMATCNYATGPERCCA